jgi:hypothetical protein
VCLTAPGTNITFERFRLGLRRELSGKTIDHLRLKGKKIFVVDNNEIFRGAQKPTGENLKVVWAKFSTLS